MGDGQGLAPLRALPRLSERPEISIKIESGRLEYRSPTITVSLNWGYEACRDWGRWLIEREDRLFAEVTSGAATLVEKEPDE